MQLNSEQVELINSFLVKNEVVFDDMRFEIIDHIATDVEENYNEIPFHEAIKIVLKKWETQIKLSNSFWVSSKDSFPQIILSKLKRLFIPQVVLFITVVIIGFLVKWYVPNTKNIYENNKQTIQIIYGIWFLITTAFALNLFFSKGYTTNKYVFKRSFYFVWLWTVIFFFASSQSVVYVAILSANILSSVFLYQNYSAHFKFLKRI